MSKLYKITKKPFFGRFMVEWRNPLGEEENAKWGKVMLPSKSGGTISTWFRQTDSEVSKATIVLGHPMGKPAKGEFLKTDYPSVLLQNGYNVVVFDFNGFGESSMGNFDFHFDLLAVSQFAKQHFPNIPLAYHGVSFGCNWGIVALQEAENPFKSAIFDSAPINLPEFWIQYPTAHKVLNFMYFLQPKYKKYANFERAISNSKNCEKILFIYSDNDNFTPKEFGERFKKASNVANTALEIVANIPHAMAIHQMGNKYIDRAIRFFNDYFEDGN